jgi:glycosyltransferase involved in cell wall biosynthesis
MRILFVARPDNVHTTRWVNQIVGRGWDVHLFPTHDARFHPDFRETTVYDFSSDRPANMHPSVRLKGLWPWRRGDFRFRYLAGKFLPEWSARHMWLARLVRRLKPDMVHSMEIQFAGYLTLRAREELGGQFPTWLVSNWGSDIYLFGRLAAHEERIRAVMAGCDYYISECHRDVKLAREFGLGGEVLPVTPGAGGYDVERLAAMRQPGPTSARRLILLKGYQHWAGRSLVAIRAIELCADALKGYRVAIYQGNQEEVRIAAELAARSTGIPIEIIPFCPHEEMLRLHGQARVSIGLSLSDAASTSFFEAMIMGSFPVQSNTACADEWAGDGESCLLVPPNDPEVVAAAIRRAVQDDALVDAAARVNYEAALVRLDNSVIRPRVVAMYEKVAARVREGRSGAARSR